MNNCLYYYGEPVKYKNTKGFLINMYKNEKSEICAEIQTNNGIIETKVRGPDIKETIKTNSMNLSSSAIKNNDEICSGCILF